MQFYLFEKSMPRRKLTEEEKSKSEMRRRLKNLENMRKHRENLEFKKKEAERMRNYRRRKLGKAEESDEQTLPSKEEEKLDPKTRKRLKNLENMRKRRENVEYKKKEAERMRNYRRFKAEKAKESNDQTVASKMKQNAKDFVRITEFQQDPDYRLKEALSKRIYRKLKDTSPEAMALYRQMINQDARWWKKADQNSDDPLNEQAFQDVVPHEESSHMRDVPVIQTAEDIDRDKKISSAESKDTSSEDIDHCKETRDPEARKQERAVQNSDGPRIKQEVEDDVHSEESSHMKGVTDVGTIDDKEKKISLDEYIGHMFNDGDYEEEPSWVKAEREQFAQFKDKSEAEAKHLIYVGGVNRVSRLSKEEIVNKYDRFMGSHALSSFRMT